MFSLKDRQITERTAIQSQLQMLNQLFFDNKKK